VGGLIRTGAVLFTDMVSSTALRTRLGDRRAEILRKHHDDLLVRAVTEHAGEILRWTGDGVKVAFASASDAVAAAASIRREVRAYGGRADAVATFDLRIGIAAGEVIVDDGDHHGVPVVQAARLEALARPNEILVTDIVRVLSGRRVDVVFEPVGERTLKGLDEPVTVHRVVDPAAAALPELPRWLAVDDGLPMVGRDEPLASFERLWAGARSGRTRSLVVAGRTGSGRSRILGACARTAHADGGIVLGGSCRSGLGLPYAPIVSALQSTPGLDEVLDAALSDQSGPLARLFPGAEAGQADAQPVTARFELFDAVAALIRRLTRLHPVLLAIDDLHLASSSTALLVRHLIDELPDERLVVVATTATEELDRSGPAGELLAAIHAAPGSSSIELAPLRESDVAQLVRTAAPGLDLVRSAEVAGVVMRETAGSPLYASALVEHVVAAVQGSQVAIDALPLPSSVRELADARLVRLPDDVVELLTAAAVIGPAFDVEVLASVVDQPVDDVLDLLEVVQRAALVEEIGRGRWSFTQGVVRATLLDRLNLTRRARVHRRVAEALEQRRDADLDELARHWREAGDDTRALAQLERAARRDLGALAYESARTRYQELVELLARDVTADSLRRAEVWLGLGTAGRALGDPAYTDSITRAARLARSARNPALVAEAAALSTWPGTFFFIAEMPDDVLIELCEDALTTTERDDPMRVRVLATLASHITFGDDRERRVALIAEANELAALHDDPHLTAMVLNAEVLCLWEPSTFERRAEIGRDLGRLARATGDPEIDFLARFFTAYCLVERGELEQGRAQLVALLPTVKATRNRYFAFLAERLLISIDIARGEPDVSPRIDQLLHDYADTYADTEGTWPLQTGGVAYQRGTLGSMVNTMEAMTTGQKARTWIAALALARLWAGDLEGARRSLREQGTPPRNYFWISVVQVQSEVAATLGELDRCAELFDDLVPFSGRVGITASGSLIYGLVDRSLGHLALALGRSAEAIRLLTRAVEQAEQTGMTMEHVVSRRLLATALISSGRRDEAITLVDQATDDARRCDFARELALLDALRES
jgi:class 3 adenylate cyclase/tetratricopeptide (TPR) repeat protein